MWKLGMKVLRNITVASKNGYYGITLTKGKPPLLLYKLSFNLPLYIGTYLDTN